MRPRLLSSLAAAALSLAGANALAQTSNASRSPWFVGTEVSAVWHIDASHDVFSNTMASPLGGLYAGRDLFALGPRVVLSGELAWRAHTTRRRLFDEFDASLTKHHLQAGASVRLELNRWLSAYARVVGGATYLTATIQDDAPLDADAWTWNVMGGAGAMAVTPGVLGSRLRFMFGVESGFLYIFPTQLGLGPRAPDNEQQAADRLTVRRTSLGTLDASGPYLRFMVGARF